jgi:hypothetical protein
MGSMFMNSDGEWSVQEVTISIYADLTSRKAARLRRMETEVTFDNTVFQALAVL